MIADEFRFRYRLAPAAIAERTVCLDTAPHIHNEIELLHILKGQAEIRTADNSFFLCEGELAAINPLEVHAITVDPSLPYHHRCICFDPSLIADPKLADAIRSGTRRLPSHFGADNPVTPRLIGHFTDLYRAVEENRPSLLLESTAHVSLFFAGLLENLLLLERGKADKSILFCRRVTDYLASHYHEPITSAQIAEAFFYTQSYFCRIFRTHFGVPFAIYLNMYRVSAARLLLEDKNIRIADAAAACGFLDSVYFAKSFRKYVGMSPSEYQKCQYRP